MYRLDDAKGNCGAVLTSAGIVTMYLDYAEDQAERQSTMMEWIKKLNSFLKFNELEI